MISRPIPHTLLAIAALLSLAISPASAKTAIWTGATSSNWSDAGNWDTGTPVSGDNVYLTKAGNQPTNQDIAGLALNEFRFSTGTVDTFPASFTLSGQPLTFSIYKAPGVSATSPAPRYDFDVPVIVTSNNQWALANLTLAFNEGISESGVSFVFNTTSVPGTIEFRGVNNTSGGYIVKAVKVSFYGQESIGIAPGTLNSSFFSNTGVKAFYSPDGAFYEYDVHPNMGFFFNVGSSRIDAMENVVLNIHSPITQDGTAGRTVVFNESDGSGNGWYNLYGVCSVDKITCAKGFVTTHNDIPAPGSTTASLVLQNGMLDLNGHDVLSNGVNIRDMTFVASSGGFGVGCLINSNETDPSTVSVKSTNIGTNANSGIFGGRGDIVFTGSIADTSPGNADIDKYGSGTLFFQGTNTTDCPWDVRDGRLVFDYTVNNAEKISDSKYLGFINRVDFVGNDSAPTSETIGKLMPGIIRTDQGYAGATKLVMQSGSGQTLVLKIGDLQRSAAACLDLQLDAGSTIAAATPDLTGYDVVNGANDGILSGGITWQGQTYARVSTTDIGGGFFALEGLPDGGYVANDFGDFGEGDTALYNKVDVSGTQTIADAEQVSHLRFNDNTGPSTITLSANLDLVGDVGINAGFAGLLVTANVGANPVLIGLPAEEPVGSLCGGTSNSRLLIHQYNSAAPLRIDVPLFYGIYPNNSLSKCGPGELILTNIANDQKDTNILEGKLTVSAADNDTQTGGVFGDPLDGGKVAVGDGILSYRGPATTLSKPVIVIGDATIEVAATQLDGATPTGLFTMIGDVIANTVSGDFSLTLSGAGQGRIQGGVAIGNLCLLKKTGSGVWTVDGDVTSKAGTSVLEGTLVAAGTFSVFSTVTVAEGATLQGTPAIDGILALAGTLSPGAPDAAGTAAIGREFNMTSTATLYIELGGTSAGQFDAVNVSGEAALNGNLNVSLIGGFTPTNGNSFVILTAGTITGDFAGADLPNGFTADTDPVTGQVTLTYSGGGSTYATWASGGNVGPADADDDGDGLLNGVEYAFGFDPKIPNANSAALASLTGATVNVSSNLQFAYQRPATLPGDVTIAVRLSNDLMGWTDGVLNTDYTEVVGGGDPQTVTVTLTANLATYKFARVVYVIAP